MNLNQVTVPAKDIAESVDFYRRLGLIQIVDSPHYARFECPIGEATFSVHAAEQTPVNSATTVYFECEDLDALCVDLQNKGIDFIELPADQRWLWREARLTDPSGNLICLYWAGENRRNPPWRISAACGRFVVVLSLIHI